MIVCINGAQVDVLQRRPVHLDLFEVALALKGLLYISLVIEDVPVSLLANLCQSSPSFKVCWVALVAMSSFCLLPVSL